VASAYDNQVVWLTKVDNLPVFDRVWFVSKSLNIPALDDALIKAGLNQSALAEKISVSREAVSKWMKGESFPSPDKLLRIGMLLGLAFEQLVNLPPASAVPIVSFRKKSHRVTKDTHLDNARETGELLKRLVPYLPNEELTHPPTLKEPTSDYAYVQKVAAQLREEMKLEGKEVIRFEDLIGKFSELRAVVIPALWGGQENHGNALNIHLPDSQTTWVFVNLDSNAVDFKFWMAHELGHSLAPELTGDVAEDFADRFAQALLFPEAQAARLRPALQALGSVTARIARIHQEAGRHVISPWTMRRALEDYEQAHKLAKTDLGDAGKFMAALVKFARGYPTISEHLLKASPPKPAEYVALARSVFKSPFFEALSGFCKREEGAEHYISRVLGVSLPDAKALAGELRA
jgi:transcriptional regulator with XRE-family HTH domain